MNKHLLLLMALGCASPALAQTERGTKLLGASVGNLSYSRHRFGGSTFSAALHPTAAYFVADNLALGATLDFGYGRQRFNYDQRYRQLNYGLSPVVRYYWLGSSRHRAFAEAGGSIGRTHYYLDRNYYYVEPQETKRRTTTYGYHGALGYSYFLVPTAALEVSAGYAHVSNDPVYESRNSIDVRLGFTVYLPAAAAN